MQRQGRYDKIETCRLKTKVLFIRDSRIKASLPRPGHHGWRSIGEGHRRHFRAALQLLADAAIMPAQLQSSPKCAGRIVQPVDKITRHTVLQEGILVEMRCGPVTAAHQQVAVKQARRGFGSGGRGHAKRYGPASGPRKGLSARSS